jgi:hypothetical protein
MHYFRNILKELTTKQELKTGKPNAANFGVTKLTACNSVSMAM